MKKILSVLICTFFISLQLLVFVPSVRAEEPPVFTQFDRLYYYKDYNALENKPYNIGAGFVFPPLVQDSVGGLMFRAYEQSRPNPSDNPGFMIHKDIDMKYKYQFVTVGRNINNDLISRYYLCYTSEPIMIKDNGLWFQANSYYVYSTPESSGVTSSPIIDYVAQPTTISQKAIGMSINPSIVAPVLYTVIYNNTPFMKEDGELHFPDGTPPSVSPYGKALYTLSEWNGIEGNVQLEHRDNIDNFALFLQERFFSDKYKDWGLKNPEGLNPTNLLKGINGNSAPKFYNYPFYYINKKGDIGYKQIISTAPITIKKDIMQNDYYHKTLGYYSMNLFYEDKYAYSMKITDGFLGSNKQVFVAEIDNTNKSVTLSSVSRGNFATPCFGDVFILDTFGSVPFPGDNIPGVIGEGSDDVEPGGGITIGGGGNDNPIYTPTKPGEGSGIFEWINYFIESIKAFFDNIIHGIQSLIQGCGNVFSLIGNLFNFIPGPVFTIIMLGVAVVVFLRFFGR